VGRHEHRTGSLSCPHDGQALRSGRPELGSDEPHVQAVLADDSGHGQRPPVAFVGRQQMLGVHRVTTEEVDGVGVQLSDHPPEPLAALVVGACASDREDLQVPEGDARQRIVEA
jgi:hypothetical protein